VCGELGAPPGAAGRLLALGPGVALAHELGDETRSVTLHWITVAPATPLAPGGAPVDTVLVLAAPVTAAWQVVRLGARLRASAGASREAARRARTREELVAALAAWDAGGDAHLAPGEVAALLETGPDGLGGAETARRRAACGPNRLERVRRQPLAWRFLEQFWSFFAVLLWVAGGLAFVAGLPELGWAVFAVVVVNGVFGFFQEYRAERAVEALEELLPRTVTVVREGQEARIPATEVVPGDVLRLGEGDQVPADGYLLEGAGLRVDQSLLTGESQPAWKGLAWTAPTPDPTPHVEWPERLFAGTLVLAGAGTMLAAATSMATEIGGITRLTQAVTDETSPLQHEMRRVTRVVTALAVAIGVSFFLLGVSTGLLGPADGLLFALGIIVANVPEGLLPTLTLALALGVQRMARHRALVKRLSAVEALGAATVICTDKTGTLTENRMTACRAWAGGHAVELVPAPPADPVARELLEAATLASLAGPGTVDPTEAALLDAAHRAGADPARARAARAVLAPYPFDSFRKRMTVVRAGDGGKPAAYVKGAPSELLRLAGTVRWDGEVVPLTPDRREAILAEHDRLADEGHRVLAVAVRPLAPALVGAPAPAVETDLTLLGLVALADPPRPEVPEAIALCRRAGVRVVMVTGDDGRTARAIARRIGLPVAKVVTGGELDRLRPDAVRTLAVEPGVLFARTSPAHKLAIVRALREAGELVAATGDGANDAPAMRAAHVGVAMGQRGSDVAKEAAVVVVTDDNFASIVRAVRYGRAIYANMGKFVSYIFASNVPELVPFLAFVLLGIPLPLTVMQILAVDLGTDLLPALALGAEPPEPGVMARPPRRRDQRLLDGRRLLHAYGFLGVLEAALAMGAFFWTYWLDGWRPGAPLAAEGPLYRRATTLTLAAIVAAQVGNVLACRTDVESVFRVGLLSSRPVLAGIAAEFLILLGLVGLPPLRAAFGLEPPRLREWGPLVLCPVVVLLAEEGRKWVIRRRGIGAARLHRADSGGTVGP
jgi:calcium-translocating P-type ATPase